MAKGEKHVVVLRDDAGDTYLLDHLALQETRVPKERAAEIEKALKGGEVSVAVEIDKHKVDGGAVRLQATKAISYKLVGSYTLQHTGGLSVAGILRAL